MITITTENAIFSPAVSFTHFCTESAVFFSHQGPPYFVDLKCSISQHKNLKKEKKKFLLLTLRLLLVFLFDKCPLLRCYPLLYIGSVQRRLRSVKNTATRRVWPQTLMQGIILVF
jgi:hypothetical protein